MTEEQNSNSPAAAFPLVDVSGTPRGRGRSYGEQVPERIEMAAGLYRDSLARIDISGEDFERLANAFLAEVERFDADQAEEIRGISEGSGVALQDVILINARRELISMAGAITTDADDECTAAAVLPHVTATGELFHGQNWDTSPEHAQHSLVLRVRQQDGPDLLTFTEAGALGRVGLNSAGIAITGNHLVSDRDYRSTGVPLPLIRRKALTTSVYALALSAVYATKKSGSNNMMVTHAAGEAVDIECAPDESFLVYPKDGILTHANHWESIPALCKLRDLGATNDMALASTPCSIFRSERIGRLLELESRERGISYEFFRDSFLDSFDAPYSICRPPRKAATGKGESATAASIVMNPAAGFMDVAPLPAIGARWTRYYVSGGDPVSADELSTLA